ncbi:MAG TPA: histidine kinase dimerization/phospho-acceptor domain-containing protein, partial [Oligoflexia bacterium]|nr:histidine kinase dimerization/phospho-acceptor domain-containing protein [Oligoflexia bacterium]
RRLLELRLKHWRTDLEISAAETLEEARKLLDSSSGNFALVVLDQHLPDGIGHTLISHSRLEESAVLAVSADNSPDLPANSLKAGAGHFLAKQQISEPLFLPLLSALIERKSLEAELIKTRIQQSRMETIRTLIRTLRHEINNPLGAVLGGAFLLRAEGRLEAEQAQAIRLIEESGMRIKRVMEQLSDAAQLEEVTKAHEQLFQIPGDPVWEPKKKEE